MSSRATESMSRGAALGPRLSLLLVALLAADIGLRSGLVRPTIAEGQSAPSREARREARRDATVRAIQKAGPAVANISTERLVEGRPTRGRSRFFEEFFEGFSRPRKTRSLGSGVLFDPEGYILSNAHVVARASRIVVNLPGDETTYDARLINLSEADDLALLKIDSKAPLPVLRFGRSRELLIGETVIALGNPFGLENTVTRGVISARDRRIVRDGKTLPGEFIQTDAAINPGNSGGPLINLDAELVGINTAVHASGQGIGFALPVDRIRAILNKISRAEALTDLWVGLELEDSDRGVVVTGVEPDSPADRANLAVGDLLEKHAGAPLESVFALHKALIGLENGRSVDLVLNRSGKRYRASIKVVEKPAVAIVKARLGLVGRSLPPGLGGAADQGVQVKDVRPDSPAARVGMKPGDILTKVGRTVTVPLRGRMRRTWRIATMENLAGFLERRAEGEEITIYVQRGGRELAGEVVLGS